MLKIQVSGSRPCRFVHLCPKTRTDCVGTR